MGLVHSTALSVDYKLSEGDDIRVIKWTIEDIDEEPSYSLNDLVAQGYAFCHHVDKYPADTIFIEKKIAYEFCVKKDFHNVRLIETTELDSEVYHRFSLDQALSLPEDTMTHELAIEKLPLGDSVMISHKVYVSRDFSQRVLSLFLVSSDHRILIMARCLIVRNEELGQFDHLYGAAETIAERESRIKRLVSELSERTFFRIYSEDHLARAIMLTQSVTMPPINYWVTTDVGGKNATNSSFLGLAYRYYQSKRVPVASMILLATDSYFTSPLAWQLSQNYGVDVYVCHPRGFGPSEGCRGYSEFPTSIWNDISLFISMVKANARVQKPIFLAGHFWGASMSIKYSQRYKEDIDGLVLIAPNVGRKLMRKSFLESAQRDKSARIHMSNARIILWKLTGGHVGGRKEVLKLQSDPLMKELDSSMVDSVSLNTFGSWMFTDEKPKDLRVPSLVVYGDQDEFFESKEALALFPNSKRVELPDEDSLTIIGAAIPSIADWLLAESERYKITVRDSKIELIGNKIILSLEKFNSSSSGILLKSRNSNHVSLNITTYNCSASEPTDIAFALKHLSLNHPGKKLILAFDGKIDKSIKKLAYALITNSQIQSIPSWCPTEPKLQEYVEEFCKRTMDPHEVPEPLSNDFSISAYEPQVLIGRGSFGTVWLARTLTTGKPVAIKQIPKSSLNTSGQLNAIKSELSILSRVRNNPHAVTLLNYGQDVSNIYFVFEYVIGGELFTRMKRLRGRMAEKDARFYIVELAIALNSLHTSGIVYRDLKPENVLISASGHIKLIDFGFATTLDYGEKLTSFCGSPYYIAPEMLITVAYDSAIDWWALGILAYELLSGQPPFTGRTPREVYRAILVGDIDWSPLKSHPEAQQAIKGLLKSDPLKRYRYEQLKESQWFAGIDWREAESRSMEPPFVVNATSPFDVSNFVKFDKDEARFGPSVTMRESVHVSEFSQS